MPWEVSRACEPLSQILSVKKDTNQSKWSMFVKTRRFQFGSWSFIPHMPCVHTGRDIAREQRPGVTRSDCFAIRREGRPGAGNCQWSSEWKMCCFTWATDGQWWIEEDEYTERHSSWGMLAITHQVSAVWEGETQHTHTRATFFFFPKCVCVSCLLPALTGQ